MNRNEARSGSSVERRMDWAENDLDVHDREIIGVKQTQEHLDNRLDAIQKVLIGVLISTTATAIGIAANVLTR